MTHHRFNKSISVIAAVLVIALVFVSIPNPKPAKAFTACLTAVAGALGINIGAKAAAGAAGAIAGLYVPTFDIVNSTTFDITAISAAGLKTKSCADEIMTAALKIAINLTRDMVIRWIITGRFEGPVFSASFAIDAQKIIENASRIFLSELTGINFCASFPSVPPSAFFAVAINLSLACTFPGNYDQFLQGNVSDFVSLWSSESTANDFWNTQIAILDAKQKAERRALRAFSAEYAAGQGFLGIRDPSTGKIITPGSAIATLVMESQIVSPIRQTDVANTVQQAITAIIDTAVRVFLEKGLAAATGT